MQRQLHPVLTRLTSKQDQPDHEAKQDLKEFKVKLGQQDLKAKLDQPAQQDLKEFKVKQVQLVSRRIYQLAVLQLFHPEAMQLL